MNAQFEINHTTRVGKRTFDLIFAAVGLTVTAPLFPLIALAIKLDSPGPVFYRQLRVGKALPERTELFEMIKFRTMVTDAEVKSGAVWAQKKDPRITPTGRFLRKTRLDELPQFINVMRGEMSLVGPRPERPGFYQKLEAAIPFFYERTFGVSPGITGLAQVSQGYDTCIEDVRSKLGFDLRYALALSDARAWLRMDADIIGRTIWTMIRGRGQ